MSWITKLELEALLSGDPDDIDVMIKELRIWKQQLATDLAIDLKFGLVNFELEETNKSKFDPKMTLAEAEAFANLSEKQRKRIGWKKLNAHYKKLKSLENMKQDYKNHNFPKPPRIIKSKKPKQKSVEDTIGTNELVGLLECELATHDGFNRNTNEEGTF